MGEMTGLETTFRILAQTNNEAASAVLLLALDDPRPEISEPALRSLLARRSPAAGTEIIRRWPSLSDEWKAIVAEKPAAVSAAVRDAILGSEPETCHSGLDAAVFLREYDLSAALLAAAEQESNPHAPAAAETLLKLAEMLYEELTVGRDPRRRRDPQLVRRHVVEGLEQSVLRYDRHRRKALLTAFVLLAGRDNVTLRRILQNPHERCYLDLIDLLTHSSRPGVVRLLLGFLDDSRAPSAALGVIGRRQDDEFIGYLLKKIGFEPAQRVGTNLRRMHHIPWLEDHARIGRLDDSGQHAALQVACVAGVSRQSVFELIQFLFEQGRPAGRRAAAEALGEFRGIDANRLAQRAIDDEDPHVQARVAATYRERGIVGAMTRMIELLDSPHPVVQTAVRAALPEFHFERFLRAFDMLDEEVRRTTGRLVKKVDPAAAEGLLEELKSPSRTRRLRALEMAPLIGVVEQVEPKIIEQLGDADHFIRASAAAALGKSDSPDARQALEQARHDSSPMVQEAAESSAARIARRMLSKTAGPFSPIDLEHLADVMRAAPQAAFHQ